MKNKIRFILAGLLAIIFFIGVNLKTNKTNTIEHRTDGNIVLSLEDTIDNDSLWCGTFNLIWNDLKDLAGQDIVFNPQIEIVKNLNKSTFTTKELNDASYYKVLDKPSLELKERIEKEIKEKFNETSSILDDFDWQNRGLNDYILYVMLKKEFTFPLAFSELKTGNFKDKEGIAYFGIDENSQEQLRDQVTVLYYKNDHNFAVLLNTNENDEIILARGNNENNFKDIYENIQKEDESFTGIRTFLKNDTLKIPNLKFKYKEEFHELENQVFTFQNNDEYYIDKAIQTIEFELDKNGGKVKSEAGMGIKNFILSEEPEPRAFNFDDTFVLFIKEKEKKLPYIAMKIDDISKWI